MMIDLEGKATSRLYRKATKKYNNYYYQAAEVTSGLSSHEERRHAAFPSEMILLFTGLLLHVYCTVLQRSWKTKNPPPPLPLSPGT
jgi:hypothetical protein